MAKENIQQKIKKLLDEAEKLREEFITGEKNKILTWTTSNGFELDREKSISESCDVYLKKINPFVSLELDVQHPQTESLLYFTVLVNEEPYEDGGFDSLGDLEKFYDEVEIPNMYTVEISFKTVQSNQEQAEDIARGFANRLLDDPDVCLSTVKQRVEKVK